MESWSLILIPVVTAGLLFWLRQVEVHRLASRTLSDYGSVPPFHLDRIRTASAFGSRSIAGKIWIADFILHHLPRAVPNDQQSHE